MTILQDLNPGRFHNRADDILLNLEKEERTSWLEHSCTQAVLASLEGDLRGIIEEWMSGSYSSEDSVDVTAQRVAKARGMAESVENIIDFIRSVPTYGEN